MTDTNKITTLAEKPKLRTNVAIKKEEILKLYYGGENLYNIALKTQSSKKTVKKVLLHIGVDYTKNKSLETAFKKRQCIGLYKKGYTQLVLEEELNLTRKTIRKWLKEESSVDYRKGSIAQTVGRGNPINHNAFDNLSDPNALYWIGFIYADGHVACKRNGGYTISISVHEQDVDVLEKFKKFLNCTNKIVNYSDTKVKTIKVYSERMTEVLQSLGFHNRKSYTLKPHEKLKYSKDFWRGVIDGDGSLYNSGNHFKISVCGTEDTCQGFLDFAKYCGINHKRNPNEKERERYSFKFCDATLSSKRAKAFAEVLYGNAETYMDRKYNKYKQNK